MQILIVDDEPPIRELLRAYLAATGHTVQVAANGQEALQQLLAPDTHCDLIIADIKMPVMGGWELLRTVTQRGIGVPVVLVTGQINVTAEDATQAQAFRIVHKPFRFEELAAVLQEVQSRQDQNR